MGLRRNKLAGIEYAGVAGVTQECLAALMRLLQFGDRITRARILSCANMHCLLLTVNCDNLIAIKAGFSSGYPGEGPTKFSYALQLLRAHGADIEEYEVSESIMERVNGSALAESDIDNVDRARRVLRWQDYISESDWRRFQSGELWRHFPPVIPFAVVDSRLFDLAISFAENPDEKLLTGYRRLEDIVRERTGLDEHGARLFTKVFLDPGAKLHWNGLDAGERTGRANLFTGAYMAHRNPRAHRELKTNANDQLTEFLLLNHLYLLEKESVLKK